MEDNKEKARKTVTNRANYIYEYRYNIPLADDMETPRERECLSCEKMFLSVSSINRICRDCKSSDINGLKYLGGLNG